VTPRNIWSDFEAGRGFANYALRKKKKIMMMVTIITIVTV
jgi:hypothetical protein